MRPPSSRCALDTFQSSDPEAAEKLRSSNEEEVASGAGGTPQKATPAEPNEVEGEEEEEMDAETLKRELEKAKADMQLAWANVSVARSAAAPVCTPRFPQLFTLYPRSCTPPPAPFNHLTPPLPIFPRREGEEGDSGDAVKEALKKADDAMATTAKKARRASIRVAQQGGNVAVDVCPVCGRDDSGKSGASADERVVELQAEVQKGDAMIFKLERELQARS